ncbi:hypothetical protein D7Z54_29030 [Salibacterium salarium]|uniref:Uncharacterized protein n=1 Tax=Salibacterium salarium TaxID=284579 RepID=A0A428MUU3_9BACI|nr:hypothetical protein D7Z54_29030 [Salibacterium salarium]
MKGDVTSPYISCQNDAKRWLEGILLGVFPIKYPQEVRRHHFLTIGGRIMTPKPSTAIKTQKKIPPSDGKLASFTK